MNKEETIFENETTYTFPIYLSMKCQTLPKGYVATGVVIMILVIIGAYFAFASERIALGALATVFALFIAFRSIGTPIILAARALKLDKRAQKGRLVETENYFYEDRLVAINKVINGRTEIPYRDIKKVHTNHKTTVIEMDKKLVLILDNKGFTKGSSKELVAHLYKKFAPEEDEY